MDIINIMKEKEIEVHSLKNNNTSNQLVKASILAIIIMILITIGSVTYLKVKIHEIQKTGNGQESEYYEHHYVMITDDRDSLFWQSVYEGAKAEAEENGNYVEFLGTNLSKDYSETELMQIAINEHVDGIIIEANDNIAMKRLISEASAKGIPVVTALSDSNESKRVSYVGVSSYNIGIEYGKQVCQIAEKYFAKQYEKKENDSILDVLVLMNSASKDASQNIVFSGIQETVAADSKYSERVNIYAHSINTNGTFAAEEAIRDIFMEKNNTPDVIICLDELNTTCVYQTVVDYNRVGEINIIGYYHSDTILKAIERNVIKASVSIDTKQMGEYCIQALNEFSETNRVSEYFSVDTSVITSANVKNFQEDTQDEE